MLLCSTEKFIVCRTYFFKKKSTRLSTSTSESTIASTSDGVRKSSVSESN